jgi:hypothetical protein
MVPYFRDEMYGDVKTPRYNVRIRIVRRYGDITYRDVLSLYLKKTAYKNGIVSQQYEQVLLSKVVVISFYSEIINFLHICIRLADCYHAASLHFVSQDS